MQLKSDRDKIAHLLRRFGLGASEAELEYYVPKGLAGTIDALLQPEGDDGFTAQPTRFALNNNNLNMRGAEAWWLSRMIITQKPLREKLTVFWHDHFATSAEKVDAAIPMIAQNERIRAAALGPFEDLLLSMSRDPAMIYWLDNQLNKKGKPNENFAREVMELFSLGIGHYTEVDVQEAARAFTGWGYGRRGPGGRQAVQENRLPRAGVSFLFDENQHDEGIKTILGNKGNFNGDDVVGILTGHPQTATHIAKKMWEFFAYSDPDEKLVARLASTYRSKGLRTAVLVRAIMEAPEFYSDRCVRKLYKNPVDFCIATLRSLGVGTQLKTLLDADPESTQGRGVLAAMIQVSGTMKSMGMQMFYPPDVAGWEWGEAWISTSTMVERMKWADKLFGPRGLLRQPALRAGLGNALTGSDTEEDFVKSLCSLFDVPIPASKMPTLVEASKRTDFNRDPLGAAANVSRLIFCLPEFQFA